MYRTPKNTGRRARRDDVRRVADLGARTTSTNKPFIIGLLRKALRTEWTIHSQVLKAELSSFIEHPDGTLGASDGCYDDTVMAAAEACFVKTKAVLAQTAYEVAVSGEKAPDPMSFDEILKELTGRGHELPFPAEQVEVLG